MATCIRTGDCGSGGDIGTETTDGVREEITDAGIMTEVMIGGMTEDETEDATGDMTEAMTGVDMADTGKRGLSFLVALIRRKPG